MSCSNRPGSCSGYYGPLTAVMSLVGHVIYGAIGAVLISLVV